MPTPTTSLATLRPDLGGSMEQFDLAADRQGFIGLRVLPVIEAQKASGTFGLIPLKELLQNRETKRTSSGGYNRGTFKFDDTTFQTAEEGLEEKVDDRDAELYGEYLDAEMLAAERARDGVLRAQEKRIADLVFNTTTWTGAALTTTISTNWDNASGLPITDIQAAKQLVYDNCGLWPNAVIMARKLFNFVRRSPELVDLIKYAGLQDARPGNVTAQAVAQALDVDEIIIAGSARNTAIEGQAASLASIWDPTMCMVARLARTNNIKEPCLGRVIHWGADGSQIGAAMETYRDEVVRGDIVRARHEVQELIFYTQCGHLLQGVL